MNNNCIQRLYTCPVSNSTNNVVAHVIIVVFTVDKIPYPTRRGRERGGGGGGGNVHMKITLSEKWDLEHICTPYAVVSSSK